MKDSEFDFSKYAEQVERLELAIKEQRQAARMVRLYLRDVEPFLYDDAAFDAYAKAVELLNKTWGIL